MIESESKMILKEGNFNDERPPDYFEFKYEPDHFQLWAFKGISDKDNVLVTAHTGAGKTAPALYAIKMWLSQNSENQVIYTAPIKTLSNQKFKEFGEYFDNVGILTGDVKINPSGNLLIMTAEILRNSLLRKSNDKVYEWNFNPDRVKCVILDEVHFINNKDRGRVWEEIITNLDPSIQLVMLSATISGAENLANWIAKLKRKNCYLIPTPFRPVPLHHYLFLKHELVPQELHCIKDNTSWKEGVWSETIKKYKKFNKSKKKGFNIHQLFDAITYCKDNDILPVNVFLLNKSLTESIARKIPFNLVDNEELFEIEKTWNKYLLKYKEDFQKTEQWDFIFKLVSKGVGIHHAGMIPILKEMVEILYEKKLIKVLIATETFAMGVNMPTRTVIFTQTTKFDGKESRPLRPEEYGQMAGRAGRRGLDTFGTVIILPEDNIPTESEAKQMIMAPPQKISSKLVIDYTFILKRLSIKMEESNDSDTIDYLYNCLRNTMFAEEVEFSSQGLIRRVNELEKDLVKFDNISEQFSNFLQMKGLQEKLDSQRTSIFKISQKDSKKINKQIIEIESTLKDKKELEEWYKVYSEKSTLESQLNFNKTQFENQIKIVLNYLIDTNIIFYENDYQLTSLGRIVSEVNECNPLVLGYILSKDYLNKLDFNEIVALLSIFISDRSIEEPYISDLDISNEFSDILNDIGEMVDKKMCEETDINNDLPYKFWSDWDLHLSMFNVMLKWPDSDVNWKDVYHLYETFEGNFCRNVLRLVNLLRNVESIARLMNDTELLNKLDGYQEKLIKDIVIIDSLYL